jgi:hypothetical protein
VVCEFLKASSLSNAQVTVAHLLTSGEGIELSLTNGQRDGRWTAVLRSLGHASREKATVSGQVFLPQQSWHLLSVRHTQQYIRTSQVALLVDGQLEFEQVRYISVNVVSVTSCKQELPFPFSAQLDTQWVVGNGLDGKIASIAMWVLSHEIRLYARLQIHYFMQLIVRYGEEVSNEFISLLHDAGVQFPTLDTTVRVPQTSFDSGHTVLGLTLTKGERGRNACRIPPLFVVTPYVCMNGVPHTTVGIQNMEHIEVCYKAG